MQWIDVFMFNGDVIAKLRLSYLYKHVNKFYVCEQRYTHQGERKNTLFIESCKEWFEPYMDKVVFVVDETNYEGGSWVRENEHRNYVKQQLLNDLALSSDKILYSICDCDEIPNIELVNNNNDKNIIYSLSSTRPLFMRQSFFYYNFKWFTGIYTDDKGYFISDTLLKRPETLHYWRETGKLNNKISLDCGWHFSYFMSKEGIKRKLESFAHTECNQDYYKDMNHIVDCIQNGKDLFGRNMTFSLWKEPFPSEFDEFKEYLQSIQT